MFSAINSILTIFLMIGVGFYLSKKGWLNEEINKSVSKIIVNVSLPLLMINNITTRFNREELLLSTTGVLLAFCGILLSYGLALLICNFFRVEKSKRGIFCAMFAFSNTIFIGLPVNVSLFGEKSVVYVLLYYLANTTLFWTIGVYNIRISSREASEASIGSNLLRKILTPPLLGFLIGILLVILNIKLPVFIIDAFKYIGSLTTPLSMFFIGSIISFIKIKDIKLDFYSYMIIIGKFIVTPIIFFFLLGFVNFPILLKKVFIIEAAMPVLAQAAIVTKFYNVESEYTTILVTLTTLISLILLPVYAILLNLSFL
jgi:hypothetical protein